MRKLLFGVSLLLAPVRAHAGGLPSAFNPHVFALAICYNTPDPQQPGPSCYDTVIESEPFTENASLLYYLVTSFKLPSAPGFAVLHTETFRNEIGWGCCGVVVPGLHRYKLFVNEAPSLVGKDLYLETYANGDVGAYGIFATSTTPEPSTWVLLGTGMLGVAALRRRRKQALSRNRSK